MTTSLTDGLRRVKMLSVPQQDIACLFSLFGYEMVIEFSNANLPRDFELISVGVDTLTRCFHFLISHPSFQIVPDGCEIQVIPGNFRVKKVDRV